ncbi:hypothetical protein [Kocuria flava]|uniref:COG1470 family protein n=1 Tax=Kocuria flava TaxID=446860 RepID=UPI002F95110D
MSPTATLETPEITLQPGGAATVSLTVRNDGDIVDEYRFRPVGPLAAWIDVDPPRASVYPGDSTTVTVSFQVPRSSRVPAGVAPFAVQALTTEDPSRSVVAEGEAEILPFGEITAELVPRTSEGRSGGRHRVSVENHGNAPADVRLRAQDQEERLELTLGQAGVHLVPGTVQVVELKVRPRERLWRGSETSHPFTVSALPEDGPAVTLPGTYRQEPVLPGWSPRLLKYLVVLAIITALVLAAVLAFNAVQRGVGNLVSRVTPCIQGAVSGDPTACQDLFGGGGGGGGGSNDPEERIETLEVVAPEGGIDIVFLEIDEDLAPFAVDTIEVIVTPGDTGRYTLNLNEEERPEPASAGPLLLNRMIQDEIDGSRSFSASFTAVEGQFLRLGLECSTAVDDGECEVAVELQGVVLPPEE